MTKDEALDLALEFFETMQRYKGTRSNIFTKFEPTATGDYVDLREFDGRVKPIITAIRQARALDKMAENARELGLDYEPVTWRNAAIRVGEDLCSVGPFGYYDMTAEQWLDWALSVVTVHAPPAQPAPVQEPVAICPNCLGTKKPHADDQDWRGRCDCAPPVQPAPTQAPVAWMAEPVLKSGRGTTKVFCSDKRLAEQWDYGGHPEYGRMLLTPLYTTPPAAPTVQEPVAWPNPRITRAAEITESNLSCARRESYDEGWNDCLEACKNAPPAAQRPFVGLTDEDKRLFSSWLDDKEDDEVFVAIEAKLRGKNNG